MSISNINPSINEKSEYAEEENPKLTINKSIIKQKTSNPKYKLAKSMIS